MAKYTIDESTLQDIADAIREKTGGTGLIGTSAFAETIRQITAGGGSLSDFLLPVFVDPDTMTYSPSYAEIGACVQALLMGAPTKYPILLDLTGSPVGAFAGVGKDDAWVFGMASALTNGADYYHYSQLKGYWLHIDGSAEPFGYFEMSTLDNPATSSDIVKGKSAYVLDENNFRELLHGTYVPSMDDLFIKMTLNDDGTYTPNYSDVLNEYLANGTLSYIVIDGVPLFACGMDYKDHETYPTVSYMAVNSNGNAVVWRLKYDNTWTMETVGDGGGIELLPITLTYGSNTFEPDYYTIGVALEDAMAGNGNKYPVIVNNIFGNGGACIFCGVTADGILFCSLEPAENEDTGESTHLRFAYVLRPNNTFVYTMLGDLRNILYADESNFAGGDQVLRGYDYIDVNTGDIKEGTYEPPEPEDLSDVLTEQDSLIDQIEQALIGKASGGGITPSGTLEITENGEYDVTDYASANVSVPTPAPVIQSLNVTENGTYTAPEGVDGYSPVVVNVASSGGGEDENEIIMRTITSYANSTITKVGNYAFDSCTKLVSISLPAVTSIGGNAFSRCAALTEAYFPLATTVDGYAFYRTGIVSAILPVCTSIGGHAFNYSSKMSTLVLGGTVVCSLNNTAALVGTKIESGTGYIYVPDDLVDSYKAATNWSTYASQIKPLSEYTG